MDVTSFGINHEILKRGIYVSRTDTVGNEVLTTFDIRMKEPNREEVMSTGVMHTLEHLMATFLREHELWSKKTIYVGPMGCRTGMYVVLVGKLTPVDVLPVFKECFSYMAEFNGEVPAAKPSMCGNYKDHDLEGAKKESKKFLDEILNDIKGENMNYPRIGC